MYFIKINFFYLTKKKYIAEMPSTCWCEFVFSATLCLHFLVTVIPAVRSIWLLSHQVFNNHLSHRFID